MFHCVAITKKLNRKRLIDARDPTRKRLRALRDAAQPLLQRPLPTRLYEKRWHGQQSMRDPHLMLYWLDCSTDIKQQRNAAALCKEFATLLSVKSGIPAEDMLKDMEFVTGRLLVKSRMRLDCAAMLLSRRWWATVCKDTPTAVSVHVMCDASPQWRGTELLACTIDVVVGNQLFRRMAPPVALGKSQFDATGKLAALLWQVFLMMGPTWASLRAFCGAVRGVTTDMGTERLLADSISCLRPFLIAAFPNEQVHEGDADQYLFERVLFMPGFRHLVDNWIKAGLSSMRRFPMVSGETEEFVAILAQRRGHDGNHQAAARSTFGWSCRSVGEGVILFFW